MIAKVILDGGRCVIREWLAHPHHRNPALAVHQMQSIVLRDSASSDDALILEKAVDVDGDLQLPTLFADQLFYSLPGSIIEIVGMNRGFAILRLRAIDPQPICMV